MNHTPKFIKDRLCGHVPPPGSLRPDDPPNWTERSSHQQALHETAVSTILGAYEDKVPFSGRRLAVGEKLEWDLLIDNHDTVAWVGQNTGSCVGANFFNSLLIQIFVEALIKQTGELAYTDWWWLFTYRWGRHYGGFNQRGDGSYLSVQYKAAKERGMPTLEAGSFPRYEVKNNARWVPASVEYEWSDGSKVPTPYDDAADETLVHDGAMITTMEAVDDALLTGPISVASMMGSAGTFEKEGVKMWKWDDRWAHNMGICGVWNHPKLGMLHKWMNRSWGSSQFSWAWGTRDMTAKLLRDRATEVCVVRDWKGIEDSGVSIDWIISLIMQLSEDKEK